MKKFVATAAIIASACGVFGVGEILAESTTTHQVQKGDTLWDLSEGYLHDPLLWPKIWKMNPRIADPHWIWPGQIVVIPGMRKSPGEDVTAAGVVGPVDTGSSALARAGLASTSEPLPVLVAKRDLSPTVAVPVAVEDNDPSRYYDQGIGMLTNDIPQQGRVLRTEQGWRSAALGETVLISAPGAQVGQQFGVYRDLGKVKALTYFGKSPGHLLADIAIVEVVASDASRQEAVIRQTFAEVKTGDVLGQVQEKPTVSSRMDQAGTPSAQGTVVAFHFMRQFAGPEDILYLNIGADQGLTPGDLLSVAGMNETEGRTSGKIMILRVAEKTAAAVVTRQSAHEVRRGDVVGESVF